MKEESTRQVVAEIRDLASGRGWKAVEELADRILSGPVECPVLVVDGGKVDSTAFRRWIEQTMNTTAIATADIARIGAPRFPALFAGKLVAVFECGRVLEAAEVNAVLEHFQSRPLDSFAIVFTNAGRLQSEEDLDLMARAIWRVLAPGPARDWRHQDLAAHRCYFWDAAAPKPFLEERCRRDREELAALLRRPVGELDRESLDRDRAVRLVDFARELVTAPEAKSSPDFRRRRAAQNEIAELRRKIRRRLDAEAGCLGREITASVLQLEQTLLRAVAELKTSRELSHRLDEITQSWRMSTEAELSRRAREIESGMRALFAQRDCDGSAPAVLTLSAAGMPALQSARPPAQDVWRSAIESVAAITVVSLLPVSAIASVLGAGVFVATLSRHERRRTVQVSRSARQAIQDMIERAIPELRSGLHRAVADYRNRLVSGLLESETALAAASCQTELSPETGADSERLLSYRRRL